MKKKSQQTGYSNKFNTMIKSNLINTHYQSIISQSSSLHKSKQKYTQKYLNNNKNSLKNIEEFVTTLSQDPQFLNRFIHYPTLITQIQTENQQIQLIIEQKRKQTHTLKNKIQELTGQNKNSTLSLLKQNQKCIQQQINSYQFKSNNLLTQKQLIKSNKTLQQKQLKYSIKSLTQNNTKQLKSHRQKNSQLVTNKTTLLDQIKTINNNINKLKQKYNKNQIKKISITQLRTEIQKYIQQNTTLKLKQSQQLTKYQQSLQNTQNYQLQLKNNMDRRLTDFIKNLSIILQTTNMKQFEQLVYTHESRKIQYRPESLTTDDSKSDNSGRYSEDQQWWIDRSREKQLINMQNQNPILKTNRLITTQQLSLSLNKFNPTFQHQAKNKKQFQESILSLQNKLVELNQIEINLNDELQQRYKKVQKLNRQINQ